MTSEFYAKKMTTTDEIAAFWQVKREYEERDIFPSLEDDEPTKNELINWFRSQEYYEVIMQLRETASDGGSTAQFVFFYDDTDRYLGFALYKIYTNEDGKAFILDFSIDEQYRNLGLGTKIARFLEELLVNEGALYYALNCSNAANHRFWQRLGYVPTEPDEHGEMIYIKRST